jgi:hypothetical protein
MNTEKLYSICIELNREYSDKALLENLEDIINVLQAVINNPADPNQQKKLAEKLQILRENLSTSYVNDFSAGWKQTLKELKGDTLFGREFLTQINSIFERNQITPAVAMNELQALAAKHKAFKEGITSIIMGFKRLELEKEVLEPNHTEIGFLIPRTYLDNDLEKLGNEIHEITFILNQIAEYSTGQKQSFKIKSISSSDFLITINAETITWVLLFAKGVSWLLDQYKKLLEIRKSINDLKSKGVPDQCLSDIENHANKVMEDAVEKIIIEIDGEYFQSGDIKRKNELKNGIRIGFNKLINRIDKGYNIEIRVSPPTHTEEPEKTEELKKQIDTYMKMKDISTKLEYMQVSGKNILSLPETTIEEKKGDHKKEDKK